MSSPIKNKQILVTSDFDMNNNKVINVKNPENNKDATTKIYVDSGVTSLSTAISSISTTSISTALSSEISTLPAVCNNTEPFGNTIFCAVSAIKRSGIDKIQIHGSEGIFP